MRSVLAVSALLLSVLFIFSSCTEPEEPVTPQPTHHAEEYGKRDYVWTIDTLSYPGSYQTLMKAIWGSSSRDVYVIGDNDGARGKMYRFDGTRWTPVKLSKFEGGFVRGGTEFNDIYGFDSTDIWAVGMRATEKAEYWVDSSLIIHFDGVAWRDSKFPPSTGWLQFVWGLAPNDVWAGGTKGTLLHWDGVAWTRIPADEHQVFTDAAGFSATEMYFGSVQWDDPSSQISTPLLKYLNRWDGEKVVPIDSAYKSERPDRFGTGFFRPMSERTLFSARGSVLRYERRGGWVSMGLEAESMFRLGGSSSRNLYALDGWSVYHWNGVDWKSIPVPITDIGIFTGVWSDNKETFIVGNTGRRSYIMRGR